MSARQEVHFSMIPHWVVIHPDLTHSAVRVYAVLSKHANRSREAWPGLRRIATEARCSLSTVQLALEQLEKIGAVIVERGQAGSHSTPNTYVMPMGGSVPTIDTSVPIISRDSVPTIGAELEPVEQEPKNKSAALVAPRPRNEVWDALSAVFGEPETTNGKSLRGKLVRELKSAGATPAVILERVRAWPHHFDDATLTETALLKHWTTLGRVPLRANGRQVQDAQVEREKRARAARTREVEERLKKPALERPR